MDLSIPANEVSLYFHIPFCTQKCAYCHFYVLPDKDPLKQQLMQGLRLEWQRWLPLLLGKKLVSVYFGGGTPALLGPAYLAEILGWIQDAFLLSSSVEITLEANPENITRPLMESYRLAGINRVSIGIQTLDNPLLQILERVHSAETALEAVLLTAEAGIGNISVDLMYDLPGQTLETWKHTLKGVRELPITHLSLYNLTIEPHTVFFKNRQILSKQIPDEDASLSMYQLAIEMLEERDLKQYEISAFSKNDHYSRHNVGYWIARPFLGLGPSAFSYWEGKRFRNIANLSRYTKALSGGESPIDFEETLAHDAHLRELLAIQLRLIQGVNLRAFQQQHGQLDAETLASIFRLEESNFLRRQGDWMGLTNHGVLFYDSVAVELI